MEANYVHKDSTTLIQDETGAYIEIPRNRITFKSKEAEIIFDLTLENDELRLKNQELKEKIKKLSQWDTNKDTRNSRQRVANAKLIKENQELKKHLEVPETCNLKTLEDYKNYYEDTTREQILEDTYIEYCAYVNLAHRYSELKKQLEEDKKLNNKLLIYNADIKYTSKKFIKYLEDEIKLHENDIQNFSKDYNVYFSLINDLRVCKAKIEEILQKYKSIIGDDE